MTTTRSQAPKRLTLHSPNNFIKHYAHGKNAGDVVYHLYLPRHLVQEDVGTQDFIRLAHQAIYSDKLDITLETVSGDIGTAERIAHGFESLSQAQVPYTLTAYHTCCGVGAYVFLSALRKGAKKVRVEANALFQFGPCGDSHYTLSGKQAETYRRYETQKLYHLNELVLTEREQALLIEHGIEINISGHEVYTRLSDRYPHLELFYSFDR